MGILNRRRPDHAPSEDEIVNDARNVAERLERIADRLEDAVARLAEEIADPNDHPDARARREP